MDLFIYRTRKFTRLYYLTAAVYFIWFLVGLVVVSGGIDTPLGGSADFIFLALASLTLFIHAAGNCPAVQTFMFFAIITVVSGSIEFLGAVSGFPFGSYAYTDAFGPTLGGILPLAIPLAWWVIVWPIHVIIHSALSGRGDILYVPVLTAIGAVWADLIIEPVATLSRGYWQWSAEGVYYGVPWTNFLGWFFTALLLSFVLQTVLPHAPMKKQALRMPLWVLTTTLFTFWLASIVEGYWLTIGIGIVFFATLFYYAGKGRTEGLRQ